MSNAYYDSYRSRDTYLGLADLNFPFGGNFTITSGGQEIDFPLQGKPPSVASYPGSTTAFLVLRNLVISSTAGYRTYRGNHEALSSIFTVNVPIGGGAQTFQLPQSHYLVALGFQSFTAAIGSLSIGDIQIIGNDGVNHEVFLPNGNIGGTGVSTLLSLVNQFGAFGAESLFRDNPPSSPHGWQAQLSINNTSGLTQSFTLYMLGAKYGVDDINVSAVYIDPVAEQQTNLIETARCNEQPIFLPIGLVNPIGLADSGSGNYGTLRINVSCPAQFYNTVIGVNGSLSASLVYLLPGVN